MRLISKNKWKKELTRYIFCRKTFFSFFSQFSVDPYTLENIWNMLWINDKNWVAFYLSSTIAKKKRNKIFQQNYFYFHQLNELMKSTLKNVCKKFIWILFGFFFLYKIKISRWLHSTILQIFYFKNSTHEYQLTDVVRQWTECNRSVWRNDKKNK